MTAPDDITAEATGASGAVVTYSVDPAADLVDGDVGVTCNYASGSTFALGTTTVTCSAMDQAGNTGTDTFTITVQDTTAPDLQIPADQLVEATSASGATVNFSATATDAVDADPTVECDAISGDTFSLGATLVSCTATDDAGNESNGSFTITVQDTTAPAITVPDDITAEATGAQSFKVTTTNCATLAVTAVDDIENYSTGGTTLRYDTTGGQFIQNWQLPKAVGTCYTVTMTAVDGSTIVAYFNTK